MVLSPPGLLDGPEEVTDMSLSLLNMSLDDKELQHIGDISGFSIGNGLSLSGLGGSFDLPSLSIVPNFCLFDTKGCSYLIISCCAVRTIPYLQCSE